MPALPRRFFPTFSIAAIHHVPNDATASRIGPWPASSPRPAREGMHNSNMMAQCHHVAGANADVIEPFAHRNCGVRSGSTLPACTNSAAQRLPRRMVLRQGGGRHFVSSSTRTAQPDSTPTHPGRIARCRLLRRRRGRNEFHRLLLTRDGTGLVATGGGGAGRPARLGSTLLARRHARCLRRLRPC